jgi:hypothetical protein
MNLRHAFVLILGSSLISSAAAADKAAPGTNSVAKGPVGPAAIKVPASRFNIPSSTLEGRDPFFPNSARLQSSVPKNTDPKQTPVSVTLQLKGISGTGTNRVALINTTTFRAGDEDMVNIGNGRKVEVTCISIGEESCVVEVLGARQELRLRQPF